MLPSLYLTFADCWKEQSTRPIVFICHSLGGLVVKQALVTAKLNDKYNNIIQGTRGMVFFGTPHRGGNGASVVDIACRAVGLFTGEPASELLPVLCANSIFADTLSQQFHSISLPYRVVSFFEESKTAFKVNGWHLRTGVSQMVCTLASSRRGTWDIVVAAPLIDSPQYIVERESARLFADTTDTETLLGIHGNHSEICKFESFQDPRFLQAQRPILDIIDYARNPHTALGVSMLLA